MKRVLFFNEEDSDKNFSCIKIEAKGLRFVNGISSSYHDEYPIALRGIVSEAEFKDVLKRLNEILATLWPCVTCYVFGFACAPCTLGLSFCFPAKCVSYAEDNAQELLHHTSLKDKYYSRGISWKIRKTCCTSWLEIRIPVALLSDNLGNEGQVPGCKMPLSLKNESYRELYDSCKRRPIVVKV